MGCQHGSMTKGVPYMLVVALTAEDECIRTCKQRSCLVLLLNFS